MGSVFSPYYRRAWRRGQAVAEEHCSLNVVLYSPGASRWTMTERGRRHVSRSSRDFQIGPSAVHWDGDSLVVHVEEWANPLPRRVCGTVRVRPQGLCRFVAPLDAAGRHRWGPIAPSARVEVDFSQPGLRWQGPGYLDSNEGDEPVSEPFDRWDWMRAPIGEGDTAVVYDVQPLPGQEPRLIATRFAADGSHRPLDPGPSQALPRTGWGIRRQLRSAGPAALDRTLEDTPFYARSVVRATWEGQPVLAMHETLSARRFAAPWVQALLPFRMPRRG